MPATMIKPRYGRLNKDVQLPWKLNGFFPEGTAVEIVEEGPIQIEGMDPMIKVLFPGLADVVAIRAGLVEIKNEKANHRNQEWS